MMCAGAIGFGTLARMARLKDQVAVFNGRPDMLTRVAVAPFKDQTILIFIEPPLPVDVITVEHLQYSAQITLVNHPGDFWRHACGCFLRQVLLRDVQGACGMLLLANHLLNQIPLFIRETMTLP